MTPKLNEINDCKRELEIIITKEEFLSAYNSSLKNVQKNIRMPGFRPGKVPVNFIEKQYGNSLKFEAQEEIANKTLKEFIEANEIKIVGTPVLMDIKENKDGSQTIKIEFEVIPDFELKDYQSIEIDEPVHRVTDEEVEKEIEYQARELGEKEDVEIISDVNVIITGDSCCISSETKEVLENEKPIIDISMHLTNQDEEQQKLFLNAKIGDEIEYPIPNSNELRKFIIKKIAKVIPSEINDDFAKLASNEKFDNIEDYKQEIGFYLQKQWDDRSKSLMEEQVWSKMVELHKDFTLPLALIENAKNVLAESFKEQNPRADINELKNQEYFAVYADRLVRVEIIKNKIIDKEELKVEDFDVENFIDDFYLNHPEMGGTVARDVMLTHARNDESLKKKLLQKKLTDLLMDFAKTNEINFDDYIKLKNENKEGFDNAEEFDNTSKF